MEEALLRVRQDMGWTNVQVMVPLCALWPRLSNTPCWPSRACTAVRAHRQMAKVASSSS